MSGNKLVAALLLGLLPCTAAWAEGVDGNRLRTFREQYEIAGRAYDAQDYAAAIPALQAAFAIQPVPQILFNIAQAYRKLELYSSARVYFELYRSFDPARTPELDDLTQRLIAELEELEHAKTAPKIVERERTRLLYVRSSQPLPRWLRPLGAVTGLAGLGLLTTGTALFAFDGRCASAAAPPVLQCGQIYSTTTPATALTALGAGVLALGAVTFAISFKRTPKPTIHEESPRLPKATPTPIRPALPARDTLPALPPLLPSPIEPPPAGWDENGKPVLR